MDMIVSHWSANAAVLAVSAAVVIAHLTGMRALTAQARRAGTPLDGGLRNQAVVFYLGVLTAALALVSPVGYWSQRHIWVRSVQDLLLVEVAPALIVLGAPWLALARGLWPWRPQPGEPDTHPGGPAMAAGSSRQPGPGAGPAWPARRTSRGAWLFVPVLVTVSLNAVWWVWHLSPLYDAALGSSWVYAAEVAVYLGLGVAFWLQVIGSRPVAPQFGPVKRVMLMAGTVASGTVLAMALAFGSGLFYPAYLGPDHGMVAALADQQLGGAVLWVLSLPLFVVAAVAILNKWLKNEESDTLAAGLDRLLKPPTSAWPSWPGR